MDARARARGIILPLSVITLARLREQSHLLGKVDE